MRRTSVKMAARSANQVPGKAAAGAIGCSPNPALRLNDPVQQILADALPRLFSCWDWPCQTNCHSNHQNIVTEALRSQMKTAKRTRQIFLAAPEFCPPHCCQCQQHEILNGGVNT